MTFLTETVPSGNEHDIQYNKDGLLHGDNDLEWDQTTKIMTVNGDLTFPFIQAVVKLTITGGIITGTNIFIEGYGYKNVSTSVTVPGGQNGSIDIYVVENVVSSVVITNAGSSYTDGTIDLSPDISRYGTVTANKFINGNVTIEDGTITGLTNLSITETITAQQLSLGAVDIQNNSVSGLTNVNTASIVADELTVSNVTINDTVGISGVSALVCTGTATIDDLYISGLTITTDNISGVNNLSASGNISVSTSINSGNVSITADDITGVNDITSAGTLFINSLSVNGGATTLDNLGNFVTDESITISNELSALTITDGTLTVNNGTITGATDLTVSNNISLQGESATLTIGSVVISNDNITGFDNVSLTGTIKSDSITAGSINAPIGSNMIINSTGNKVTINEVTFQSGVMSATNVRLANDIQFTSTEEQKIYSNTDISIEAPSGIVSLNGTEFDTSGNITSATNLTTTGTITAGTFTSGTIVMSGNDITGVVNLNAETMTTSGTLTITGATPSIDSTNKITITSGSNPTVVNGVTFQEGNITTVGDLTASDLVASGTIQLTSLTPTIESANDISITSTGGFVTIGGLTINNGQMTDVKSLTTTTDITIGGDLSLNGTSVMNANVTVVSEIPDVSTLTGPQGSYINGTYINTLSGITVTVTVTENTAAITSIVIASGTPDNTYIIPITIPLLGRITSTSPIVITSTNGITIDTTTITPTGDVTANSLTSGTVKTDTITSDSSSLAITNPSGNVTISGVTITPSNNITGITDLTLSGTVTSDSVITDSFTSASGTFTNLSTSNIVVDDFTIGGVIFDNGSVSNVNGITCSSDITTGDLTIIGALNVDNINTAQIGGVTFDTGSITATEITTSGTLTAESLLLTGGTKTLAVSEITTLTKIAGIVFDGTSISGLTSLTSTGTITADTLTLSGNIVSSTISNPSGAVTIDSVAITDGNVSNVSHLDMSGDLTATSITANTISSNTDLVITPLPTTNENVLLIDTANIANVPLYISGASGGLTLTVDGTSVWSVGDRFLLAGQNSLDENDIYEIITNVDPISIQRLYNQQSIYSKSFTSTTGTTNNAKTFVTTNTYNRSQSGIDVLVFAESADPTLTVGGVGIRSGAIDASFISATQINVNNVTIKHTGTQSYSLVLPTALGTTGEVLVLGSAGQLEWTTPTAYTLGGSEGSIQFSSSGLFDGSSDLTWVPSTGLTIAGTNKLIINDIEISHDTTDGLISNQTGDLVLSSPSNVVLKSSNVIVKNIAGTQVASIDSNGDFVTTGSVTVGPISINSGVVTGVVFTSSPSSLVSKEYVDKLALGIKWVEPVTVSSETSVTLSPAPATIDGFTLVSGTRVILTGQAPLSQNGIYFLDISGDLSRPLSGEFASGYTASGSTVNATESKEAWLCTSPPGSDTVGTHDLTFIKLVSGGVTAGKGITLSGNTVNLDVNTDQFEFVDNKLSVKQIPIANLSENSINITGDSGVIISNSTPLLGDSTTISLDRSVIMDLNSDQTLTGVKTFSNGLTVSDLSLSSDLNVAGTITAGTFTTGNISIAGTTVHGITDLTLSGVMNASNVITNSVITPSVTNSNEIVISSNNGVKVEGISFNKNVITDVNSVDLIDNISVSNIVKQTGDIVILPGAGSSTVVNGIIIKDNVLSNVKGIKGIDGLTLFSDTTGTVTIGGPDVTSLTLTASDTILLGTASGTVTTNDLIVSTDLTVQGNSTIQGGLLFTSITNQTITKDTGTLAFIGDTVTFGDITFAGTTVSGIGAMTSTSITSGSVTTGNLNVSSIISATDLDLVSATGVVNISNISFDNGVIYGAGDIKTNNILASNTSIPATIFTDSTSINIGGVNTTDITLNSSSTTITGDATVTGDITVTGDATVTGDITVSGDLIFDNDTITKVSGELAFTAPLINLNGVKIDTNGNLQLNAISVAGNVAVAGSTHISRSLTHDTLTIGDGTISNTTTVEGSVFTNGTLSTGAVQCNEIQANIGSVMNILAGAETIEIGGSLTDTVDIQADIVNITGTTNVNVLGLTAGNINVAGNLSVANSIQFTNDLSANSITSASDLNIIAPTTVINNVVTINNTTLTSTVPVSCTSLNTASITGVNTLSSSTGIVIDAPTLTVGSVVMNASEDSITGLSSVTSDVLTATEITTSSVKSSTGLVIESSAGLTINDSIVISKVGGLTGITELLTNSLQSSDTNANVDIYTETAGTVNIGSGADTINMGSETAIINIGTNANTNINIGDSDSGSVTIDSYKTTVLGDISTTGNLVLQGNDSTISGGTSGQLTIETGPTGVLSLNGFQFSKVNDKAVIDYTGSDASNVSLFNTTPGHVTIGGSVTESITLESQNVELTSDQVNILADEEINIGSTGKVTIEAGQEGIVLTSEKNISVSSNVTISGDVFVSGNIQFTDSNVFDGFSSIKYPNESIVNASNLIVTGTIETNNLSANNISSNAESVTVFSDSDLEIGGNNVTIGNTTSTVKMGSVTIENDTIYTPERLNIQAHTITLGNPDDPTGELHVNKKVQLNGGIEKVRSLKATHLSTNYLRCNRMQIASDPSGFYETRIVSASYGTSSGIAEYTRMGNFVNVSGTIAITDKTGVQLDLSNCPRTKKPTVLKVGRFPQLIPGLSQVSLVDTEDNFTHLDVRVYDANINIYRNLVSSDFVSTESELFTFSGSYTTDVYDL